MPNFSGVWSLREQGVAVKGERWQLFKDPKERALYIDGS